MPPALDDPESAPAPLPSPLKVKPQVLIRQKSMGGILNAEAQDQIHGEAANLAPVHGTTAPTVRDTRQQLAATPSQIHTKMPSQQDSKSGLKMKSNLSDAPPLETSVPPPIQVASRPSARRAPSKVSPTSQPSATGQQLPSKVSRIETPVPPRIPVADRSHAQRGPPQPATQNASKKFPYTSSTPRASGKRGASHNLAFSGSAAKKQKFSSSSGPAQSPKPKNPPKPRQTPATSKLKQNAANIAHQVAAPTVAEAQAGSMQIGTLNMATSTQQPTPASSNFAPVLSPSIGKLSLQHGSNPRMARVLAQMIAGHPAAAGVATDRRPSPHGVLGGAAVAAVRNFAQSTNQGSNNPSQASQQDDQVSTFQSGRKPSRPGSTTQSQVQSSHDPSAPGPLSYQSQPAVVAAASRQNSPLKAPSSNISRAIQRFLSAPTVGDQQYQALRSAEHYGSLHTSQSPAPPQHTLPLPNSSTKPKSQPIPVSFTTAQANTPTNFQQNASALAHEEHLAYPDPNMDVPMSYMPRIPTNIPATTQNPSHQFPSQAAPRLSTPQLSQVYKPSPLAQSQTTNSTRNAPQRQPHQSSFQRVQIQQPSPRARSFAGIPTQNQLQEAPRFKAAQSAAQTQQSSQPQNTPPHIQSNLVPRASTGALLHSTQNNAQAQAQPRIPPHLAQSGRQPHELFGSAPQASAAGRVGVRSQPRQNLSSPRPVPAAELSKGYIWDVRHFILYFGKYIGYPNIILPKTNVDQCVDEILKILRKYHSIGKVLEPKGWGLSEAYHAGGTFGSAVVTLSFDLPGYGNTTKMLSHIANFFLAQEKAAEKEIEDMGSQMLDEFSLHGRASWYYAQQLERAFFSQAKQAIIERWREEVEKQREAVGKEARKEGMTKRLKGALCGNAIEDGGGPVYMNAPMGMATLPGGAMVSTEDFMGGARSPSLPNSPMGSSLLAIPPSFRTPSPGEHGRYASLSPANGPRIDPGLQDQSQSRTSPAIFGNSMIDPRLQGPDPVARLSLDSRLQSQSQQQDRERPRTPPIMPQIANQATALTLDQSRARRQGNGNVGTPTPVRNASPDYDPLMDGVVEDVVANIDGDTVASG